jgi:hypothetical protein
MFFVIYFQFNKTPSEARLSANPAMTPFLSLLAKAYLGQNNLPIHFFAKLRGRGGVKMHFPALF